MDYIRYMRLIQSLILNKHLYLNLRTDTEKTFVVKRLDCAPKLLTIL
jgi:hypothetical protein